MFFDSTLFFVGAPFAAFFVAFFVGIWFRGSRFFPKADTKG